MGANLLISVNTTNIFISEVWNIYIMEYCITLKENKAAPCVLINAKEDCNMERKIAKIDC